MNGFSQRAVEFSGIASVLDLQFVLLKFSGIMKADEKQNWALVSPSGVAFHFGTSGLSVAVATAVTHPLGNFSKLRVNKFTVSLSQLPICLFASCNLYNLSGVAWLNFFIYDL